eukprot:SAG31_NODE_244_length_19246_cov_20.233823_16_plen_79_part_00
MTRHRGCCGSGMHVLITKPPVKTLEEHRQLLAAAAENNVLVQIEVRVVEFCTDRRWYAHPIAAVTPQVHKRFDPIYAG